ncbi:TraX family protein [Anaerosphaera multitolerans]|uniref:Fimbrial assembly protein fimC n=1 Tax=Anaerosphaera multitolerans TaxID=2487351 RepID=A0A437S9A7_9FIRM|nr:TraX family protein [Anaerosphaera multitolerans]RVU55710.1 fimbrial assembly protein fimC [Anaerosphaera multitolerans]
MKEISLNKNLNAFHLKIIAIIAMLLNHLGSGFKIGISHPYLYLFTETIGKLTFPIMAFLLVEGFYHTRNFKKYALRLAVFWIISIVPFKLYFFENRPFIFTDLFNNIMFTLLMGLLMMYCLQKYKNFSFIIVLIFMFLTSFSDWGIFGIIIIFCYYNIKDEVLKVVNPTIFVALPTIIITLLAKVSDPSFSSIYVIEGIGMAGIFLTIPLLLKYNGERGYSPNWVKYGFYLFYPLHLTVLLIIRNYI